HSCGGRHGSAAVYGWLGPGSIARARCRTGPAGSPRPFSSGHEARTVSGTRAATLHPNCNLGRLWPAAHDRTCAGSKTLELSCILRKRLGATPVGGHAANTAGRSGGAHPPLTGRGGDT